MRLDHLLSREIRPIRRIAASLGVVPSIQHPAPGAPAPRHLDSRTAKRSESMTTRGRGKPPRPPRTNYLESIQFKTIRILHDRNDHSSGILYRFERPVLETSVRIPWMEDVKGARRMPWRGKSTKGAASCDKPWGGANGLRSRDSRMGEPSGGNAPLPAPESNRAPGGNRGN